jgi:hypothetical protein
MSHFRIPRPSPSLVVALIALFAALGGAGAYALQGRNSVDSGDLINRAVKHRDLAPNSVDSNNLRPNSISGSALDVNQQMISQSFTVAPGMTDGGQPLCPKGTYATGGGWLQQSQQPAPGQTVVYSDFPFPPSNGGVAVGWQVSLYNSGSVTGSYVAYALCQDS